MSVYHNLFNCYMEFKNEVYKALIVYIETVWRRIEVAELREYIKVKETLIERGHWSRILISGYQM